LEKEQESDSNIMTNDELQEGIGEFAFVAIL